MAQTDHFLGLYLHLARAAQQRNRPWIRDKFLVLAGAVAAQAGLADVAAECRRRVLAHNPRHLVGHHGSFEEGLSDERFQNFLNQLRRRYNQERCEHMLRTLGISLARERQAYYSDREYAAALLSRASSAGPAREHAAMELSPDAGPPAREVNAPTAPNRRRRWLAPFDSYAANLILLLCLTLPITLGLLGAILYAVVRFRR